MSVPPVLTPTARLRCGLAHAEITPHPQTYHRLWGAARHDRAEGVHRPLRATALVFEPLEPRAADDRHCLIALDLCLFRPPEMEEIRAATCALSGLSSDRLHITFSHTHSSGNFSRERSAFPGGDQIGPYLDALPAKLAAIISEAASQMTATTWTCGSAVCSMGHNRDLPDLTSGRYVCGFNPSEPEGLPVVVARISDDAGRLKAVLVNYGCHPTTLAWENRLISPDYIGALRESVEAATGAPCLFLLAPCGDVGPRKGFVGDPAVADRNGRQLAWSALSAFESLPPDRTDFHYTGAVFSGATLGTWADRPQSEERQKTVERFEARTLTIPVRYVASLPTVAEAERALQSSTEAEAKARSLGETARADQCRAEAERHRRLLERIRPLPTGDSYPFRVDLWRLGDLVFLVVEGEPYQALQSELLKRFPHLTFLIAVLSNGARPSYLPERSDYGKSLYQTEIAVVGPGSLERVIDAIAVAVQETEREGLPSRGGHAVVPPASR